VYVVNYKFAELSFCLNPDNFRKRLWL